MKKLVIITTVPLSLATLIKGQPKYLSHFFDVTLVSSSSEVNKEIQENEGVELKAIDMTRKITLFQDAKALIQLCLFLVKKRPDIVYTFTPKAGLLGMIASFITRVPIRVHNVVGMPLMEATGAKLKLLKFIEKLTYVLSTNLFCNSYGLKEYIQQNLTKREINVVANGSINGVDTDYFKDTFSEKEKEEQRKKLGIYQDDFVLLFVGRVVKDKGVNELLQAFTLLHEEYKELKLLIVGDFEEELSPIEPKSVTLLKTDKNIISVGFQKDIRPYLSISNLFVLPSYREGLPNSLIEAGSFGIPLLATDINGCNEVIIPNKTGILVEKKSVESLVEGISKLLDNKELYQEIKDNIRRVTIERYGQEIFYEALKSDLEKLVDAKENI